MKKEIRFLAIFLAVLLAGMAGITVWIQSRYVNVGGEFYVREMTSLDLRGENISMRTYGKLSRKLPNCTIIWDVPFQEGKVPSNTEQIMVERLRESDLELFAMFPRLKTVHAENCTDYDLLIRLQEKYPECKVLLKVPVSGISYSQDVKTLQVTGLSEADVGYMRYLKDLSKVTVSGCEDYAFLQRLQQEQPDWNLSYTVPIAGASYAQDTKNLEIQGACYDELYRGIPGMPELESLTLVNPDMDYTQLQQIRKDYPRVDISYKVELFGQSIDENAVEVDLSGIRVDDCAQVETALRSLPKLEKLIMSDCGVDNETMAQFRERQRDNYKVVWTVYFSEKAKARTDELYFMPIQQGEYYLLDEHTENLKYCEDMICLDLGHHMIHNIDFVRYMPHLRYLILAHTGVRDVSPIVACQELVYLEVDWSEIKDYTPIKELKALEDLNLNKTYCDLTPIMEMTWLKNLWVPGRSYDWGEKLREALPDTRVVTIDVAEDGTGWRNLPNYYAMRDLLGMKYMQ